MGLWQTDRARARLIVPIGQIHCYVTVSAYYRRIPEPLHLTVLSIAPSIKGSIQMPVPVKYFSRFKAYFLLAGFSVLGFVAVSNPPASAQQVELRQLDEFLAPPTSAPVPPPEEAGSAPAQAPSATQPAPPPSPTNAEPARNTSPAQPQAPRERPSQVMNPGRPNPGGSRTTERVESSNVAVRTTTIPRLELGPEYGEGNFIVLMTYDGDDSLTLAREYSAGAFVKQIGGDRYIQLAVFDQIEYARHLADRLRNQGLSVLVAN